MTVPNQPALSPAYGLRHHDALLPTDLLAAEVAQRRESGFDVDDIVETANETDPTDHTAVLQLVDAMGNSARGVEWTYEEPEALEDIRAAAGTTAPQGVDDTRHAEQVRAAWLGRVAGCNIGKPIEDGDHWTVEHIRTYLELADAYPLTDYVPHLDPMPAGFELRDNWPETTRGNVHGSARDDDIDYAILALHLLETHGRALRPDQVGEAWLALFPLKQIYTAERAAYINLAKGIPVPRTASFRNPYREWIGAQIRADVFGYVNPGDPWQAAALAYQDATLSHTANGVYGEMWAAALVAAAFTAADADEAIQASLSVLPQRSRLHEAVSHVVRLHRSGITWDEAVQVIRMTYGHYSWVHTINNAAAVTAALLWSGGDWMDAVGKVVMSGWDTDSNGATVGSVAGILGGPNGLPAHVIEPLQDRTRSALFGFDNTVISDLAHRTIAVART
ncbi:ADP-ribosylglycohydrolase family protein [Kribbella sp. NPDC048928]|uniref:ADP-ribosylglycohydrolase family protein n=1 Tax=Kribbella sp. NPDC048928 TaxID=3364111 RepID=UPI00371BC6CB